MTIRTYIRTDRNGTKYYRCKDFNLQWTEQVRTPEYEAKLQARREARRQKEQEAHDSWLATLPEEKRQAVLAEEAKLNAELDALKEKEKAEREAYRKEVEEKMSRSQYVGEVGQTIESVVTVEDEFWVDTQYDALRIIKLRTEEGNVLIWKTRSITEFKSKTLRLRATVKEHKEYKDRHGFTEKQTIIARPSRVTK